jgi:hypothetical protein
MEKQIKMGKLCKGYQIIDMVLGEKPSCVIGVFYAVYPDGRVYKTDVTLAQYRTNEFNFKGAKWTKSHLSADDVKVVAEYNGNYKFPV